MHKIIVPPLAAVALSTLATSAWAETVSIDVSYADLNLSSQAGLAVLERRIESAVDRICGKGSLPLYKMRARQRCAAELMTSVREQVARVTRGRDATVALNP